MRAAREDQGAELPGLERVRPRVRLHSRWRVQVDAGTVARALVRVNPEFRGALKAHGFLTRDAREVERKKYGRKGARARFQFSKR